MPKKQPPHILITGDEFAALTHMKLAKKEMMRTRELTNKIGVSTFQRIYWIDRDAGAYIRTRTAEDLDIIEIFYPYVEAPPAGILSAPEPEEPTEAAFAGIYSGLTDVNDVYVTTPRVFTSFNPTTQCREDFPDDFVEGVGHQTNSRLVLLCHSDIQMNGSYKTGPNNENLHNDGQSNLVHPCQYSGPMAEIASVVLGLGTASLTGAERAALLNDDAHPWWVSAVTSQGFYVQYDFKFLRCNQAVRGPDGWWLVELSASNGIVARRLPLLKNTFTPTEPVAKAFVEKYGGIPSGEAFPNSRTEILQGIEDGWIVELMSPDRYDDEFLHTADTYQSYSILNSWTFNEDGTEGRTTSYYLGYGNRHRNCYWKVQINMDTKWAGITQLDDSLCCYPCRDESHSNSNHYFNTGGYSSSIGAKFYDPEPTSVSSYRHYWRGFYTYAPYDESQYNELPSTTETVVWVGRMNGHWSEIKYRQVRTGSWIEMGGNVIPSPENAYQSRTADQMLGGEYVTSISGEQDELLFLHPYSTEYDFGTPISWRECDHGFYKTWGGNKTHSGALIGASVESHVTSKFSAFEIYSLYINDYTPPSVQVQHYVCGWNRNAYLVYAQKYVPATDTYQGNLGNDLGIFADQALVGNLFAISGWPHSWTAFLCPPEGQGYVETNYVKPVIGPNLGTYSSILEQTEKSYSWKRIDFTLAGTDYVYSDDGNGTSCVPGWYCDALYKDVGWGNYVLYDYTPHDERYMSATLTQQSLGNAIEIDLNYLQLFPEMGSDWFGYCRSWPLEGFPHLTDYGIGSANSIAEIYAGNGSSVILIEQHEEGHPYGIPVPTAYYDQEVWVVGHKVPGEKMRLYQGTYEVGSEGTFVNDRNLDYTAYVFTPTLGTDAVIYPDVTTQTGSTNTTYATEYTSSGTLPSLPTTTLPRLHWRCTFIGINGPSSP